MPFSSSTGSIHSQASSSTSTLSDYWCEQHQDYPQDQQQQRLYREKQQPHSLVNQHPDPITFSTQSPTILPMTDYNHRALDVQDLHARLVSLEDQSSTTTSGIPETTNTNITDNNNKHGGYPPAHAIHPQRRPRSSIDSALMPRFTKSATMSTTGTNDTSGSTSSQTSRMRAHPSCATYPESVGLAPGTFSKPRVPSRSRRSRSNTQGSMRSRSSESSSAAHKAGGGGEFKYYGRHSNQWLFNDFSVTDAVARGFRRVFSNKEDGGRGGGKDWYEDRER